MLYVNYTEIKTKNLNKKRRKNYLEVYSQMKKIQILKINLNYEIISIR